MNMGETLDSAHTLTATGVVLIRPGERCVQPLLLQMCLARGAFRAARQRPWKHNERVERFGVLHGCTRTVIYRWMIAQSEFVDGALMMSGDGV